MIERERRVGLLKMVFLSVCCFRKVHYVFLSPVVARVVISRRNIWAGHGERMGGEEKMREMSRRQNLNEGPHLGELCVYGQIILKWNLKKQGWME